jgi:ERCC4-type nuclease
METPDGPTIIVDTREQRPLSFTCPTRTDTLKTCDYSLEGYEDMVGLERKSMDDLIACLGKQRDRFERELVRARDFQYSAVIVEGTFADLAAGNYISRMNPNSAVESISAFEVRYKIPFLFCGTQALAARKCESLLRKFYREKMIELDSEIPF